MITVLALLCPLYQVTAAQTFDACGNYCGPGWCAASWTDETACVASGRWGTPTDDGSCIDRCCKAHDHCCGSGDRSQCNELIAECAYWCSGACADAVWLAMSLLDTFCCGAPCDANVTATVERQFGRRLSASRGGGGGDSPIE